MWFPHFAEFVACCILSAIAEWLALDVIYENLAVAGYANAVAFLKFSEPQLVDRELAPEDAAVNPATLKADFVEVLRKTSLALGPCIHHVMKFGSDHVILFAAEGAVRQVGAENQML